MLSISKVYKIQSWLESAPKESDDQQQLRWECLSSRLLTLEPLAQTGNPEVVHELSNIVSQLFDLKHLSLLIRDQKKLTISQLDLEKLNDLGKKSLLYTTTILKDKFPEHEQLIQETLSGGLHDCLQDNHIFQVYVNLMLRVASKAELMVIDEIDEKIKYL